MKATRWTVWAVAVLLALPVSAAIAQDEPAGKGLPNYTAINLGTLGGSDAVAYGINRKGWIGGTANLTGDTAQRGVLWLLGLKLEMGTFGGANSESEFAPNVNGQTTGTAETAIPDPLGQDHCGWGTHLVCIPFLWEYGIMIPLTTLGGPNGVGVDINTAGQIVGDAETRVHDPSCIAPQVLQYLPAVWENGTVKALPTVKGDPDGVAIANNDNGQAAGYTGNCGSNQSAQAVLWQDGKPIVLPSLGGEANNGAQDMNDLGVAVGFSDLPGDTVEHAVIWEKGKVHDLGTLSGDVSSSAYGINNLNQVVGESCDAENICRAFLWQDGVMTDLNALLPLDSPLDAVEALDINDSGEIVGQAYQWSNGDFPAFLAVPVLNADGSLTTAQVNSVPKATFPQSAHKSTPWVRGRVGAPSTMPQ
jgi:probable HAF family extracellular repeat protein